MLESNTSANAGVEEDVGLRRICPRLSAFYFRLTSSSLHASESASRDLQIYLFDPLNYKRV